jgi:hypothetical protein
MPRCSPGRWRRAAAVPSAAASAHSTTAERGCQRCLDTRPPAATTSTAGGGCALFAALDESGSVYTQINILEIPDKTRENPAICGTLLPILLIAGWCVLIASFRRSN